MVVAAHQPNYLPNLGFFYKILRADKFVIVSNIQFEKQEGWQQRHKIKGANGDIWLTVPVLGSQNQLIKNVRINNSVPWYKKHKKSLELSYHKTSDHDALEKFINVYEKKWDRLVDLNMAIISLLKDILNIPTHILLDEEVRGDKQELLINICKKYNADSYLSGVGAKGYMTADYFNDMVQENIEHNFIKRNITSQYPYSTIHYILTFGREHVINLLEQ